MTNPILFPSFPIGPQKRKFNNKSTQRTQQPKKEQKAEWGTPRQRREQKRKAVTRKAEFADVALTWWCDSGGDAIKAFLNIKELYKIERIMFLESFIERVITLSIESHNTTHHTPHKPKHQPTNHTSNHITTHNTITKQQNNTQRRRALALGAADEVSLCWNQTILPFKRERRSERMRM